MKTNYYRRQWVVLAWFLAIVLTVILIYAGGAFVIVKFIKWAWK